MDLRNNFYVKSIKYLENNTKYNLDVSHILNTFYKNFIQYSNHFIN